jgi:UDP-N-acetylglucosamine--N-acetylmuramyl-(pentapeptide) pyrophosphoryl-undecaprenol N-acetylglucosamine transferase
VKLVFTGGHHSSALPVIQKLRKKYPNIEIYWFGHKYSMKSDKNPTLEYQEITALNIPFYSLRAGKFYKTFNPIRILKIPLGVFHALLILIKVKPDLIVSFGGYLAVPTVIAGFVLKIPSITHEQTVVTGYANKVISKFAKNIMISWPQSQKHLPKDKTILTGLPLREDIFEVKSENFVSENDLITIYITAGKTGSHKINQIVLECLPQLLNFCNVIHQCGDHSEYTDYTSLKTRYEKLSPKPEGNYFLRKFIFQDEIGEALVNSDLIVSRSGAHITAELIALEKPCVLIPIPWVSHNEQFENARMLQEAGIGHILEERELSPETLLKSIKYLSTRLNNIKLKNNDLKKIVEKDSASLIMKQIEHHLIK